MSFSGKVCVICHPYALKGDTGRGGDRYVWELVTNLRRCGLDPLALHSGFISNFVQGAAEEFRFAWRLGRASADVFHATSPVGGKTAALLGKRPLVTTIHDVLPLYFKGEYDAAIKMHFKAASIRYAVARTDRIIVPFPAIARGLIERAGADPSKIRVIHHGTDHAVFHPRQRRSEAPRVVLFIGEVGRNKGVDTLLTAFSRIHQDGLGGVQLWIGGGWGPEAAQMKQLAAELALGDAVRFLGYIPDSDLPDLYHRADLFVFPSRYGFGLPTLEAMACGTPTISGGCFDAIDFVADAGLLIEPGDVGGLAEAMRQVLTDPRLSQELSTRGIAHAKHFSWEQAFRQTIDVYEEVA